jgi:hypothetical protein
MLQDVNMPTLFSPSTNYQHLATKSQPFFKNTKTILDKKVHLFPDFQFLVIIQIIFQLSILNRVATINYSTHYSIAILSFLNHIVILSDKLRSVFLLSVVLLNVIRCQYAKSLYTLSCLPTLNSKISTIFQNTKIV